MQVRLFKLLVAVTLTFALGLHLVLLQSAAWTGMLVRYSRTDTFTQALAKTFDGKHPCKLCRLVQKEAHSTGKKAAPKVQIKFDLSLLERTVFLLPPSSNPQHFPSITVGSRSSDSPPVPPPRLA